MADYKTKGSSGGYGSKDEYGFSNYDRDYLLRLYYELSGGNMTCDAAPSFDGKNTGFLAALFHFLFG